MIGHRRWEPVDHVGRRQFVFAGLHVAAVSHSTSVDQISAVAVRAAELGVQVQRLARFAFDAPPRAGLLFGYGAIPTARIRKGLAILRSCFDE